MSELAGIEGGGYGWGAVSVDFDHDGLLDIAETNGDNATPMFINEQSTVFMNEGNGSFTKSALALGLQHSAVGAWSATVPWPLGVPSDTRIWFQAWQQDATGVVGWISSNGLRATTP